ncbi:hypothetical protein [Deinococcus depolymerans]
MVVLMLMLIFAGVAAVMYVDNTTRAGRRALKSAEVPALPRLTGQEAEAGTAAGLTLPLLLSLPEPARTRAWALLSGVTDALKAGGGDTRTAFLLAQTRDSYLPDTLRAYAHLTPAARQTLERQGQAPEVLLDEQLALLEDGVREALRHDHAAADRLLTQGRFLRERFGAESAGSGLRQKP